MTHSPPIGIAKLSELFMNTLLNKTKMQIIKHFEGDFDSRVNHISQIKTTLNAKRGTAILRAITGN